VSGEFDQCLYRGRMLKGGHQILPAHDHCRSASLSRRGNRVVARPVSFL
jgi:hypothetical protein